MSTAVMEKRARDIFRNALFHHYIDGIAAGDDVERWLKTHHGWFPDEQADYGYGCMMPPADGPDMMSKDPVLAVKEAKTLMDRLSKTLGQEENAAVLDEVCEWLEHWNDPVQSFKDRRDRSRSPRRSDDWDAKAAALQLDVKDARIQVLKEHIQSLETSVKDKDALIEKARIDDVINRAKIAALGDVVQANDARIATLEWQLRLKERTSDMMHEIIAEHCRRASR